MFERYLRHFYRLRWQLTLSYALVTVLVATFIGIALISVVEVGLLNSPQTALPRQLAALTPQLTAHMGTGDRDAGFLSLWLSVTNTVHGVRANNTEVSWSPNTLSLVVDAQGQILAASNAAWSWGSSATAKLGGQDRQVLANALAGHTDGLRERINPNLLSLTGAAPVLDSSGATIGALFVKTTYEDSNQQIIDLQSGIFLPGMLLSSFVAGLAAVISGYFNARSLTQRLDGLAERADQWSKGEFAQVVADTSSDELGDLARHFNRMAGQIDELLLARQQLAALEERNRMARDLHDSVKQEVFAVAMLLSAAQANLQSLPNTAAARLTEAESLTHEIQGELDILIRQWHPGILQGKSLPSALRDFTLAWSRQHNVAVELEIDEVCSAATETQQSLYRVAQEALSNVSRHSQAATVRVSLACTEGQVTVIIADDGCGFELSQSRGRGLGLQSMRHRVELEGGSLAIDTAPGKGTTVTAACPTGRGEAGVDA
ncbi:MAG TPA: ATP-binding protein [Anaerolineae bacterium]